MQNKSSMNKGILLAGAIVVALLLLWLAASLAGTSVREQEPASAPSASRAVPEEELNYDLQPVMGDRNAPIRIVEFGDYKCPACKRWTELVLSELHEEFIADGTAAFYYIHYPFLAPDSELAAVAGEILYHMDESAFWTYHTRINELQGEKDEAWANESFLTRLVERDIPSIDAEQFRAELKELKHLDTVKADMKIARKFRIGGTPTVLVNGQEIEDISYEGMREAILSELSRQQAQAAK
ncbi:MAG: thioredoxin domain-containing protein [Paenibacillus dendritiformis]|uniref:DsbA family protein n=1 Tax=Paenibacillus dendritiformis TaxID=130049 RepID=UPI00143DD42D|nr:thioredoxin domain-containing protein [Paenibacillus dendritiformis]MDU5142825.1 thioredoxin domain-containing protein [Paenibacillus dendritiformis]NKI22133.1 thioredoxin domain-containing protein [Paenibacillus dendritiformis]NRF98678.1 thioredoxin domain-containing protein [Paenibacillus dendritiformis]